MKQENSGTIYLGTFLGGEGLSLASDFFLKKELKRGIVRLAILSIC